MAVKDATDKLKTRIAQVVTKYFNEGTGEETNVSNIVFSDSMVIDSANPKRSISFNDAVIKTYLSQVSLGATGFYRTPDIWFDRDNGTGHPYYYYSFG